MPRVIALLAAALLALALAAPVHAEDTAGDRPVPLPDPTDVEIEDILRQLPGIIDGLADNRTDMARCPALAGGTVGTRELADDPGRSDDEGNPLDRGDASRAPSSLPARVVFRGTRETFNRRYQFAVRGGDIWYKSHTPVTGIREPWARLPLPDCFDGRVAAVSVDDDELVAVDRDRWVYLMDGALRAPSYFNWSMRWGRPFWTGPGRKLPRGTDWEWSVVSPLEDVTWRDPAGNDHPVGDDKVSHIWVLRHHGQWLTYTDPWLPPDESYQACGPHRGRFRAQALSASGSNLFVIGPYGDMFTRLYDFDIAGADPLFFDYAYEDQHGVANPVIQLPSPAWREQPKIPGTVTDRISIHKVGTGALRPELRVEGRRNGVTGFWHKRLPADTWRFTATRTPLTGDVLPNRPRDTSRLGLGASEDRPYRGRADGARITVPTFNVYCTPAPLRVALPTGERFTLTLHSVDNIRQVERARGLDANPRMVRGTIEVSPRLRRTAPARVRAWLEDLGPGRFVDAPLDVTLSSLEFRDQGWVLRHG
jgi:hypothetical protein